MPEILASQRVAINEVKCLQFVCMAVTVPYGIYTLYATALYNIHCSLGDDDNDNNNNERSARCANYSRLLFFSRKIAKRFSVIILVLKLNRGITYTEYIPNIHTDKLLPRTHTFRFDSSYIRLKLGFLNCFFAILSMNKKKACITSS